MIGRDTEPDFMLSSGIDNFYKRSAKGMKKEKYASLEGVEKAIKNLIKSEENIMFSITTDVNFINEKIFKTY